MNVKGIVVVGILLMLLYSPFSVNIMTPQSYKRINSLNENNGRTLYVGGDGPNNYKHTGCNRCCW